jgi:WD40 repeat protein
MSGFSEAASAISPLPPPTETTSHLVPSDILGNDNTTIVPYRVLQTDPTQYNKPICVALNPKSNNMLLAGYFNRTINIWQVNQQKIGYSFLCDPTKYYKYNAFGYIRKPSRAQYIAWHPSGDYFVAAFDDRSVKIYMPKYNTPQYELLHEDFGPLTSLRFNTDGNKLLVLGSYGKMRIYDTTDYSIIIEHDLIELLFPPPNHKRLANLGCAVFVPDETSVLFGNGTQLYKFNYTTGELMAIVEHIHDLSVMMVECKRGNTISGSKSDLIINGVKIQDIGAIAASFNNDATLVAVIDDKSNNVKIIDIKTREVIHQFGKSENGWSISWVGHRIAYCNGLVIETWVIQDTIPIFETLLNEVDIKLGSQVFPTVLASEVGKYAGIPPRQTDKVDMYLTSNRANPAPKRSSNEITPEPKRSKRGGKIQRKKTKKLISKKKNTLKTKRK